MDIKPVLNLNRHPRDCDDFSLIDAENVRLSLDKSVLVTEESIKKNNTIKDTIDKYYGSRASDKDGSAWKIIGCIPCIDEMVLFIYNRIVSGNKNQARAIIVRYDVNQDLAVVTYNYQGGIRIDSGNSRIKGTFTYNVENALIVAIAEDSGDDTKFIPLKTINLGKFNEINNENIYSDLKVKDQLLSSAPEVYLPNIENITYVKGSTYKGWHYFFIRFKINKIDYTQWYNFGTPIFVDNIEEVNIIKHGFNQNINADSLYDNATSLTQRAFPNYKPVGFVTGCSDFISNSADVSTNTVRFNIKFNSNMNNLYNEEFIYQVGVIISSKSYTKVYKTFDNNNNNNNIFTVNPKEMTSEGISVMEFISDNYNYYNIKNITSYKNRLYISNYKENNINSDLKEYVSKISSHIVTEIADNSDLKYNVSFIKTDKDLYSKLELNEFYANGKQSFQFDTENLRGRLLLNTYLGIEPDTQIKINGVSYRSGSIYITTRTPNNGWEFFVNNIQLYGAINIGSGTVKIEIGHEVVNLNLDRFAMLTPIPYANTKDSFEYRCKQCTLIPGEVYNFYIHYIDKYGQFTNGYKIENDCKITDPNGREVYPIEITIDNNIYYATVDIRAKVIKLNSDKTYSLNVDSLAFYSKFNDNKVTNKVAGNNGNYALDFIKRYSVFCTSDYEDYEWWQLVSIPATNKFGYYYNNDNEKLFKVPMGYEDGPYNYYFYYPQFKNITIPKGFIGYFISYEKFESIRKISGLLTNNDFRVNHYIKQGGRVEYDSDQMNIASDRVFPPLNFKASNKMKFYSGELDTSDKISFDYSIMELRKASFPADKYLLYWQQFPFFAYPKDLNKPHIYSKLDNTDSNIFPIPKYKLAVADSAQDDRMGLGTCIEMDNSFGLFKEIPMNGETNEENVPMYIATLINPSKDIYMNKEKILVRCSDYIYYNNDIENSQITIKKGLNGHITYDGVIIYDGNGVSFNEETMKITGISNNSWFYPVNPDSFENDDKSNTYDLEPEKGNDKGWRQWIESYNAYTPFMNYVQFPLYTDRMYESKSFKKAPKPIIYPIYVGDPGGNKYVQARKNAFATGCMVTPVDSIDLFENRQDSADTFNPKTYTNYRDDLLSIEFYDKTLRRSNVIQDESRINGWRTFPTEGYKNLAENKGKITNLYGVGTIFLVHTEHSLFMFDTDNTMKTENKTVQLYQPDTFEVDYKEVLTSDLGYGGLQDNESWIADQFGYIFYNRDFNRFFIFDAGQLGNPDEEILEFLNKYHPHKCIFANDKVNHRLLVKMTYLNGKKKEDSIILSFDYDIKKFISRHTYDFDVAYNTKINLFLQYNDGISNTFYEFIRDSSSYSVFENQYLGITDGDTHYAPVWTREAVLATNVLANTQVYVEGGPNPYFVPAKLKIVVNSNYNLVKFIEYITYKLYKINAAKDGDYVSSPVERRIQPFSGVSLRVYNDQIDTGVLDILVNSEDAKNVFGNYDKPYWDLGNWNFSYLRNTKDSIIDDIVSRLYGNWFVFEFVINNDDNKVEFESLMVNLSKDKRV